MFYGKSGILAMSKSSLVISTLKSYSNRTTCTDISFEQTHVMSPLKRGNKLGDHKAGSPWAGQTDQHDQT